MKNTTPSGIKNTLITIGIIAIATVVCILVRFLSASELPIHLIFVLAVLIVSRLTDGFIFGAAASAVAVFIINFAFTYPLLAFNFTISGYPFTFVTLFVISIITSTLTTQIKKQEKIRADAEREKLYADFLRAISHDLRTPLTTIVGSTSAILDSEIQLSEEQKRMLLFDIRDDASWLIRMVENILSVTQIRGETSIRKTPEPLEELVGDIVSTFKKRYPKTNISVSIPENLFFITIDATLIKQVLINLMENAVLHGTGMTCVVFSVEIEEKRAVFSVINDGDHIDVAALQRVIDGNVFAEFEQVRSDNRRDLGIGLSVCTSIVKAHGGKMFINSNDGGGVCVGFILPYGEGLENDV